MMKNLDQFSLKAWVTFACAACCTGLYSVSYAQDSIQQAERTTSGYTIEEVVVTARKTEENLQDTPIAVTAFTSKEIETRGLVDVADIGDSSPNVQISSSGSAGPSGASDAPSVFIRGIGLNDFTINTDPAVGMYVDNVYIGRSVGSILDLLDLERVEVLRGPQGTLFGANNIGGAISLITAKPTTEARFGNLSVLSGEDDWFELRGMANIPLNDTAALRVSGVVRQQDGFVTASQYDNLLLGSDDMWALRAALRFEPTDDLTIDIAADYSSSRETPAAVVGITVGPAVGSDFPEISRIASAYNNNNGIAACATPNYSSPIPASAQTDPGCVSPFWTGDAKSRVDHSVWTDRNGNPIKPENEFDVYGFSATIEWQLESGTFKSITAFRGMETVFYNDIDHTPLLVFHNNNKPYDQDQFSQELQFKTLLFDDRLNLTIGGFYFEEDGEENVEIVWGGTSFGPPSTPPGGPINAFDTGLGGFFQDNNRLIKNEQIAIFAQGTFDITETVHVTAGLRWTESEKSYETMLDRSQNPAGFPSLGPVTAELSTDEVAPLVSLGWSASDTVYTYLTYSEGFRDGGWAARFTNGLPDPLPHYEPEFVESFEGGIKSDLTDNLRVNFAVFFTDYNDYQVVGSADFGAATTTSTTVNIGSVELTGAELELMAVITPNIRLDWALGYLDAEIDSIDTLDGTFVTEGYVVDSSHALPFTPDLTSNLGLSFNFPLESGATISTRIDWRRVADQYYRIENGPNQFQDSYNVVNLGVTYDNPDGRWSLTLGARNLTDEFYVTGAGISGTSSSEFVSVNRPRSVFGKIIYNFGE